MQALKIFENKDSPAAPVNFSTAFLAYSDKEGDVKNLKINGALN